MSNYPIGVDISSFNTLTTQQLERLAVSADFVFHRIGIVYYGSGWALDTAYLSRMKFLKETNPKLKLGAFFLPHSQILQPFSNPLTIPNSNHPYFNTLVNAINAVKIDWFAIDIEEHTARNSNEGKMIVAYLDLLNRLKDGLRSGLFYNGEYRFEIGTYSRKTWLDSYPNLHKIIQDDPSQFIWEAIWAGGGIISAGSITNLRSIQPRNKPVIFGKNPNRKKPVTFHQFAGDSGEQYRFSDFSIGKSVDLNAYLGTLSELYPSKPSNNTVERLDKLMQKVFDGLANLNADALRREYEQIRRDLND